MGLRADSAARGVQLESGRHAPAGPTPPDGRGTPPCGGAADPPGNRRGRCLFRRVPRGWHRRLPGQRGAPRTRSRARAEPGAGAGRAALWPGMAGTRRRPHRRHDDDQLSPYLVIGQGGARQAARREPVRTPPVSDRAGVRRLRGRCRSRARDALLGSNHRCEPVRGGDHRARP